MASQVLLSVTATRASLHLIGELDLAQRQALRRRVADALTTCGLDLDLELDASKVTFVDCGTLRELDHARQELARRGGRLVVQAASPVFRRVARLADYPDLLPVATDTDSPTRRVAVVAPEPRRRWSRLRR